MVTHAQKLPLSLTVCWVVQGNVGLKARLVNCCTQSRRDVASCHGSPVNECKTNFYNKTKKTFPLHCAGAKFPKGLEVLI